LIFVKSQSRRFDIITLLLVTPRSPQLKGPPNGGLLFALRSAQDCNSSASLAMFDPCFRGAQIVMQIPRWEWWPLVIFLILFAGVFLFITMSKWKIK
jgi:hypothetical protein